MELLTAETVRRQVSVDLTIPGRLAARLEVRPGRWVVPIATLKKELLRNFDLRDESGRALPVLTKEQNGRVAHGVLLAGSRAVLRPLGLAVDARLRADLAAVAMGDHDDAATVLAALALAADNGHRPSEALLADGQMSFLLEDLAENYILLAEVGDVSARRVLKFGYDGTPDLLGPSAASRRFVQGLALAPLVVELATPAAARGSSYHAEIAIPEELRVEAAFLYDAGTGEVHSLDEDADRASLYTSDLALASQPFVLVGLRPERSGVLTVAMVLALVVAALLACGWLFSSLDPAATGSSVTVLLAGSALFSGVVARSGERPLVRTLFALPRMLLVLLALAAIAAAGSIALDGDESLVRWVWGLSTGVSLTVAAILVLAYLRAAPRIRRPA